MDRLRAPGSKLTRLERRALYAQLRDIVDRYGWPSDAFLCEYRARAEHMREAWREVNALNARAKSSP